MSTICLNKNQKSILKNCLKNLYLDMIISHPEHKSGLRLLSRMMDKEYSFENMSKIEKITCVMSLKNMKLDVAIHFGEKQETYTIDKLIELFEKSPEVKL